ncbi:pyridoxamine 5'-phosphate oxidase family protein [Agromyces sp. MMS24-JH15]|uniref:pyridoxamine 5'-phosphate oxidase family protein n=1 Tax=Agromyces sp. MMS24-JH15 TaxID=3243765 RepID=UPI00374A12E0
MSGGFDDYLDERKPTKWLDEEQCWQRIEGAPYGRLATAVGSEPDLFPVNHRVDDDRSIVFRTSPGSKLLQILIDARVAFEVDGYDDEEVWSVVVKGFAAEVLENEEVAGASTLGVDPWTPEAQQKDRWVRIFPREVTGRSFERPRED